MQQQPINTSVGTSSTEGTRNTQPSYNSARVKQNIGNWAVLLFDCPHCGGSARSGELDMMCVYTPYTVSVIIPDTQLGAVLAGLSYAQLSPTQGKTIFLHSTFNA